MKQLDLLDTLQAEWRRERPDLDTSAMGVLGRIVVLGELLKKSAGEALAPHGIGYTDLDVLATLRRSGAPFELRPMTLLRTVLIQSGSLTACLDRLERAELVERVPIPEDRRGRAIRLTSTGQELVDRAIEDRFAEAGKFASVLKPSEQNDLARLLRKLLVAQGDPADD